MAWPTPIYTPEQILGFGPESDFPPEPNFFQLKDEEAEWQNDPQLQVVKDRMYKQRSFNQTITNDGVLTDIEGVIYE